MEYGRCSEWNGMEDLKNRMEDRLPYFHTNYIYSIFQNLRQITKDYQTKMRMISHFSVRVSPNPSEMGIYYRLSLLLEIVLNYRSILLLHDILLSPMNYCDKQFFMPTVFKTSKSMSWHYGMNTRCLLSLVTIKKDLFFCLMPQQSQ